MIVVIMTNQQTQQVQMTWEGGDPQTALQAIMTVAQSLNQQIQQQQAEASGGQPPPAQRASGLIVPSTVLPKDIRNGHGPQ